MVSGPAIDMAKSSTAISVSIRVNPFLFLLVIYALCNGGLQIKRGGLRRGNGDHSGYEYGDLRLDAIAGRRTGNIKIKNIDIHFRRRNRGVGTSAVGRTHDAADPGAWLTPQRGV